MPTIRIAGVQMDVVLGAAAANVEKMIGKLREAAGQGAKLIVFPECSVSGYCFDSVEEATTISEPLDGPSVQAIQQACETLQVWCVFGMVERDGEQLYNAAVLTGPSGATSREGVIASYHKTHLPHLGVDRFVSRGACAYQVHEAAGLRVGVNICYDASFPEASRSLALAGADLIVLPTNWPPGSEMAAEHLINARALENHVYYMAVNRIGNERGFEFIGNSRICRPGGHTVASAELEEIILYADVDPEVARNKHLVRVPEKHEINRFADRRPDLYAPLTQPSQTDLS